MRVLEATQELKDTIENLRKKKAKKEGALQSPIPKIGGRRPINYRLAGQTHSSGVKFNEKGFPDFRPYAIATARLPNISGNYKIDAQRANRLAGFSKTPKGFLWHYVEDTVTMLLVPRALHEIVGHTGGVATKKHGGLKYE